MLKLLWANLYFYRRNHWGLLLGCMLASAVLTGALLVGDSVDGSLRKAALQRLGHIRSALIVQSGFVDQRLADKMGDSCAAALALNSIALSDEHQVNSVQVTGCTRDFWRFANLDFELAKDEAAINAKLARALNLRVGDEISLRIEKPGILPREAPLAAQDAKQTVRGRFLVKRILSNEEFGRFSLHANQVVPWNAFVRLDDLQERVGAAGKVNLLLSKEELADAKLKEIWEPEDFGLLFRSVKGVVQLESEQIYLPPEAGRAALELHDAEGSLTYLVNSISCAGQSTPYSFMLAKDGLGLADDEVVVNRWLANELDCRVGDEIEVRYAELQPDGGFTERSRLFSVARILDMDELRKEQLLAPAFPGLSDVDRCADWNVGIPMEEAQLDDEANEAYWNTYRQTPKAVVSLSAGQQMWANRFGDLTAVRVFKSETVPVDFKRRYDPAKAGYTFRPVRQEALKAVDQVMDFGQLFVGMSFFLIVATLILIGLLFVFCVQGRAEEMGILLALGWTKRRVQILFLCEGGSVALVGTALGAVTGLGYAWLLLAGLQGTWSGAVAGATVDLFVSAQTVVTGFVFAFGASVLSIGFAVRGQTRFSARELLSLDFLSDLKREVQNRQRSGGSRGLALLCFVGALGLSAYSLLADLKSITMPFFGAGALLLLAGTFWSGSLLKKGIGHSGRLTLCSLALRNASRRRRRSQAVIGLLASGSFLVFSVSSMKEDVQAHAAETWSGTGGFEWFGNSTFPIQEPLGEVQIRVRDGDDASCLNLNRAQSPRLLGVDPARLERMNAFFENDNIWALLDAEMPDGVIPGLVGDADTSMWGLEAKVGPEDGDFIEYTDDAGRIFQVRLVGYLPMRLSVFQGSVLIREADFVHRFPREEGWRMFLWKQREFPDAWVKTYDRMGLNIVSAVDRLMEFYVVESTYLSMFLALGLIGLLIGAAGVGVVVLRNVQDRRGELALLQAVGYGANEIKRMLLIEHALLFSGGLGIGLVSSFVAMVPALFISSSKVSVVGLLIPFLLVALVCLSGIVAAVQLGMRREMLAALRSE